MNIDCSESERFYELNRILGLKKDEGNAEEVTNNDLGSISNEQIKSNGVNGENLNVQHNKESYQRFRVTPTSTINPVRYTSHEGLFRRPIYTRRTTIPSESEDNAEITENYIQTTPNRFTDRFGEYNRDKGEAATIFNNNFFTTTNTPRDDAYQSTTRKNWITTNNYDVIDYTTNMNNVAENVEKFPGQTFSNEYTTGRPGAIESNTRIVPDLIESNENGNSNTMSKVTDEVVDTIKHLQNIFPSGADDSRTKRLLAKTDSIKNRQSLFDKLNHS